jgi:hypothetical protein
MNGGKVATTNLRRWPEVQMGISNGGSWVPVVGNDLSALGIFERVAVANCLRRCIHDSEGVLYDEVQVA